MGRLVDVGMALRDQASLAALTEDVVKTSEIEGEQLKVESVRSSIARQRVHFEAPPAERLQACWRGVCCEKPMRAGVVPATSSMIGRLNDACRRGSVGGGFSNRYSHRPRDV